MIDAKAQLGPKEALRLARSVSRVVAARGKSVTAVSMVKDRPTEQSLLDLLLGPTGRLRAPVLRVGKTLLVGFHEESYKTVLK